MEHLGGINLFTSHFVIGCREVNRAFTQTDTIEIIVLHKWLDFKDNDYGMMKYRSDRTQYIDFLEIIEFEKFKQIVHELYSIYLTKFPYATKANFIESVFAYTIYDLKRFVELDLQWLGEAPLEDNFSFYTVYSYEDREFKDFAINNNTEIEHYRQYYRVVIDFLESFHSHAEQPIQTTQSFQRIKSDLDKTIWNFEAYVINCTYSFNNIERINALSKELHDKKIYNIAHRAIQELKSMALSGNAHFESIANYYFSKCLEILAVHKKNIKDNQLNHVDIMPKIRSYFDTMQTLRKFHDELLLLLPKLGEQIEPKAEQAPQQIEKPKPEKNKPKTLDELFYNIELVQPSIDILKEIEPPLIDTDYNYIGKLKGVICVWIDELQRQGIIKHYSDRKIFASLISQKIKRFSIDESMFGKYQKKAEENYRTDIKTKVSKIKLSQNSQ